MDKYCLELYGGLADLHYIKIGLPIKKPVKYVLLKGTDVPDLWNIIDKGVIEPKGEGENAE